MAVDSEIREAPTATGGFLGTYRDLLSAPGTRRLVVISLVSKFPISMLPVSALLMLSARYSYAQAGLSAGVLQLANAVSSPVRGRLAARYPGRLFLSLCLAGFLAGLAGLAASASARADFGFVLLCAATMGLFSPPVSMLLRARWTAIDRTRARPSANGLESALMDVALVTGPVLATWLSMSGGRALPFAAVGVLMTAAVVLLITARSEDAIGTARGAGHWSRPLRSKPLLLVFGAQLLFCAALSATEVALPIGAQQHHAASFSGWYLAGMSVGSIVGALALGALPSLGRARLPVLLGAFAVGVGALVAVADAGHWIVLAVCPVTGAAVGSTFSALFTRIGAMTVTGTDQETQGWANATTAVGFACGASAGGTVAGGHGASAALLTAGVVAAAAALLARAGSAPA